MATLRNPHIPRATGAGIANLKPSLRMAEGGFFDSVKRVVGLKEDSPELKAYKANAAAEREAAKAAKAAPAAPPPKAISQYAGNQALEGRMKAAGLRNGGELHMSLGGGLDRAGFLERNPRIADNLIASPGASTLAPTAPDADPTAGAFGIASPTAESNAAAGAAFKSNMAQYDKSLSALQTMNGASSPTATPAAAPSLRPTAKAPIQTSFGPTDRTAPTLAFAHGGSASIDHGQGGPVPGQGRGDKIPAKYEPGEFVVSNDMLKADPSLRDELHGLRTQVLAEKGMTPEQADAKAVRYGAQGEGEGHGNQTSGQGDASAGGSRNADLDTRHGGRPQVSLRADQGFFTDMWKNLTNNELAGGATRAETLSAIPDREARAAAAETAAGMKQPAGESARFANGSTAQAPSGGVPRGMGQSASLEPSAAGVLKDKLVGSGKDWEKIGGSLTKDRAVAGAKMLGRVAKVAAAPVSGYQAYQDISKGNYGDAAVHGVDTAAGAALFTPAAPVAAGYLGLRTAYEAPQIIRDALGEDGLDAVGGTINTLANKFGMGVDDSGYLASKSSQPAARARPALRTDLPQASYSNEGRHKPELSGVNSAYGNVRGAEDFTSQLNKVPASLPSSLRDGMVYKTVDPATGRVTYSGRNVKGDVSNKMLNGDGTSAGKMKGSVDTVSGIPVFGPNGSYAVGDAGDRKAQMAHAETLRAPTGPVQTDNLYAGVTGNLGNVGPSGDADAPKRGEFGYNRYMANKLAQEKMAQEGSLAKEQIQTLRRGQDMQSDDTRYQAGLTYDAKSRELRYNMNKDQRDYAAQRGDKTLEQGRAAQEYADKSLAARFVDKDGKPEARNISDYKQFTQNMLADSAKGLLASNDPAKIQLGKALSQRGYADLLNDPEAAQLIEQLWQNRSAAKENAGGMLTQWLGNKGRFVDSLRPGDFVPTGRSERTVGGDHIEFGGGSTTPVNDLEGSFWGVTPASTNAYRDTIEQALRAKQGR